MQKRDSNIELFRVIAAILVTLLHVLGQGGILRNATPGGVHYWTAWFFEICAYCSVNCFALISGYIMVDKNIKLKSIVGLWFQVLFYSLLFTALFFAFVPETRTIKNIVGAVLPIVGKRWWYVSAYFALFFFIPFLNGAIKHISQRTYQKFLIAVVIGVCCIDCFLPKGDAFLLNGGNSPIWLIIVYLFGAYLKKYNLREKTSSLKCIIGFFAMMVLTFASKFVLRFLTERILGEATYDDVLISFTSITILLASIFLFLFCLNVKMSNAASKIICFISPAALGVYLIHVHPLVFKYLIKEAFSSFLNMPLILMILCILGATLAIFVVCTVIDLLRIQLFKLIRVSKLSEKTAEKLNGLCLKIIKMTK